MQEEVNLSQSWIDRGDAIFNQTNPQTPVQFKPKPIENPRPVQTELRPLEVNPTTSSEIVKTVSKNPSTECIKYVGHCSECWDEHPLESCKKRQRPNVDYVEIYLRSPEKLFIVHSLVEYHYKFSVMTQSLWTL